MKVLLAAFLGLVLGLFLYSKGVGATNYPPPPKYGTEACQTLSFNTAFRWGYSFEQTDVALHSIGCDMDTGGVYVKAHYPVKYGGTCNTAAYNLAQATIRENHSLNRGDVRRIVKAIKARPGCFQFEDGTYGRDTP